MSSNITISFAGTERRAAPEERTAKLEFQFGFFPDIPHTDCASGDNPSDHGQTTYWRVGGIPGSPECKGNSDGTRQIRCECPNGSRRSGSAPRSGASLPPAREIRPRAVGESEEVFEAYLRQNIEPTGSIFQLDEGADGRFSAEIPLFGKLESPATAWVRNLFSVEVDAAETDEYVTDPGGNIIPGKTNTLQFKHRFFFNPGAGSDCAGTGIATVQSLQLKRALAEDLIRRAPDGYTEPESKALAFLDRIASGELTLTEPRDGRSGARYGRRGSHATGRYMRTN